MTGTSDGGPRAIILRFPKKRGRPKSLRPHSDTGTPELVMKRLRGETAEALDLCLERGIVSREQHWCGIHLRWLYTLRHGAPGVRAVDPTHLGGIDLKTDDPDWRDARELEYHDAMKKLMQAGCAAPLMSLCVYNERPSFLGGPLSGRRSRDAADRIDRLRDALDVLVKHWSRPAGKGRG